MARTPAPDTYADDLPTVLDDAEFDEWTLDELERSADLGSLQSAWAGAHDAFE